MNNNNLNWQIQFSNSEESQVLDIHAIDAVVDESLVITNVVIPDSDLTQSLPAGIQIANYL